MTLEENLHLREVEVEVQTKLIKLLVEFYDNASISNNVDCDEEKLELLSDKIEKQFDLDMFRKVKKGKDI